MEAYVRRSAYLENVTLVFIGRDISSGKLHFVVEVGLIPVDVVSHYQCCKSLILPDIRSGVRRPYRNGSHP